MHSAILAAVMCACLACALGDTASDPEFQSGAPQIVNVTSERASQSSVASKAKPVGNRVIIGVLADHVSIFDLGVAAYDTWYQDVSKFADVFFVIGECSYPPALKDAVLCLDTPDVYPPQVKEFKLWQYYARQPAGKYDFFFKIDLDTYVNGKRLQALLRTLVPSKDNVRYMGEAALGRASERGKLGLRLPYCMGYGYFATWRAVQLLAKNAERCMKSFVSTHSDTEIGRCFDSAGKVPCRAVPMESFLHVLYQIRDGAVVNRGLTKSGQSIARFPLQPPSKFFDAALLHPIKLASEMRHFHVQVTLYLRPILPALLLQKHSKALHPSISRMAIRHFETSCVHNTALQLERSKSKLKECPSPAASTKPRYPIKMHVLLRSSTKLAVLPADIGELLSLVPSYLRESKTIKESTSALRTTMRSLIEAARAANEQLIGVLTEDVILHCAFANRLPRIIADTRCAGHLFTPKYGGVLSLGAREWSETSHELIKSSLGRIENPKCYNTGSSTLGTFAVIFGRATFDDVILWLNTTSNSEPFHHVLAHLSDLGHIVRTALPYIAIQDTIRPPVFEGSVEEESAGVRTASEREQLHRWTRTNYCHHLLVVATLGLAASGLEGFKDSVCNPAMLVPQEQVAPLNQSRPRRVNGDNEHDFGNSPIIPRQSLPNDGAHIGGNRVIIGVLADHVSIFDLGVAAYDTWYQDVSKFADVFFVIGECSYPPALKDAVLCLDTPDVYPPQVKEFKLWQYYARQPAGKYDFFFKIDLDTYVNAKRLQALLASFDPIKDAVKYVGVSAFGRPEERGNLGLEMPYCLGFGYFATRRAAELLAKNAERCMKSFKSTHSDTEIGRCFASSSGISCTDVPKEMLMHVYYQLLEGDIVNRVLTKSGQSVAKFPAEPTKVLFDAALVHPVKESEEMRLYHFQSKHYLRPLLPLIRDQTSNTRASSGHIKTALGHYEHSCVHNTVYQLEDTDMQLAECTSPVHEMQPEYPIALHVIMRSSRRLADLSELSDAVRLVPALVSDSEYTADAQAAFESTVRGLFEDAESKNYQHLAIVTEDVVLHCDFAQRLRRLLSDVRCSGHIFTSRYGGVLAFGSREWSQESWLSIAADFANVRTITNGDSRCHNVGKTSLATFAVLFARSTFTEVLLWLDKKDALEPFHAVLGHLSEVGFIVRTAFPSIAAHDTHRPPVFEGSELERRYRVQTAKQRERVHKWAPASFCHPVTVDA